MALAAATRSRRVSGHLFLRFRAALPRFLTPHCSGEDSPDPSPLHPLPDFRSRHLPLPQSSGRAEALTLFPFGVQLAIPGAGISRRGFSSFPSDRVSDSAAILIDAADAAVGASAPASVPNEVAWAAEDSSLSVAAVQHLIDAVHSYTGFNWCLSIAISTVLLRCVLFTLTFYSRKQIYSCFFLSPKTFTPFKSCSLIARRCAIFSLHAACSTSPIASRAKEYSSVTATPRCRSLATCTASTRQTILFLHPPFQLTCR